MKSSFLIINLRYFYHVSSPALAWGTRNSHRLSSFPSKRQLMEASKPLPLHSSFVHVNSLGKHQQQTFNLSCFYIIFSLLNNNHFIFIDSWCCPIGGKQIITEGQRLNLISNVWRFFGRSITHWAARKWTNICILVKSSVISALHWIKWEKNEANPLLLDFNIAPNFRNECAYDSSSSFAKSFVENEECRLLNGPEWHERI